VCSVYNPMREPQTARQINRELDKAWDDAIRADRDPETEAEEVKPESKTT